MKEYPVANTTDFARHQHPNGQHTEGWRQKEEAICVDVHGWQLVGDVDYRHVRPAKCAGCGNKAALLKADLFSLRKAVLKVIRFEPAVCIEKADSLISLSDCHQTAQTAWRIAVVPMCAIEAQMANTCLVEPVLREAIRNEYMVSAYGLSLYRRYAAFKANSHLPVVRCYEDISRILFRH